MLDPLEYRLKDNAVSALEANIANGYREPDEALDYALHELRRFYEGFDHLEMKKRYRVPLSPQEAHNELETKMREQSEFVKYLRATNG
jgi:hypothetical protein